MFGVNLGETAVHGGSTVTVYVDNLLGGVTIAVLGMTVSATRLSLN